MDKKLIVKQSAEYPVAAEVLAESIKAIATGIKVLRASRLTDKAIVLLIQHACPSSGGYPKRYVSAKEVRCVLDGIASLENQYLKKSTK